MKKMRRIFSGFMSLVMLLTLITVTTSTTKIEAADNLLKNGDFESNEYWMDEAGNNIKNQGIKYVKKNVSTTIYSNNFSGVNPMIGWNIGTSTETTSEIVKLDGNDVLSLKVGTRPYDTYYGTEFLEGKKYTISCRVLSMDKDVDFRLYYSDECREHKIAKANVWTEFSITVVSTSDNKQPSIYFGIMDSSKQVYIDDVTIVCEEEKDVATHTEGIGNCNGEEDSNVLVMEEYTKAVQSIDIKKGKTYEYSFDIKKSSEDNNVKIGLTSGDNKFESFAATNSWKTITGTFEATDEATEFGFIKTSNGKVFIDDIWLEEVNEDKNNTNIITTKLSDKAEINLLSGDIYDIVANYDYTKLPTNNYWNSNKNEMEEISTAPRSITIKWNCKEEAKYYTVKIADNKSLSNAKEYITYKKSVTVSDLYAATTYYYQIIASLNDKTVKSKIFNFKTAALTRTIYIDGVNNTRDIGGYKVSDNKRIRQGMVYRGGNLDNITDEGKQQAYALGIKTDLELRQSEKRGTESPIGKDIKYVTVDEKGAPQYKNDYGIDVWRSDNLNTENAKNALVNEIRTFTKKENYPIYVHCAIGRDRTGTICFLISALCGVEKNDLYKDYELSILSKACHDNTTPDRLVNHFFNEMYEFINGFEGNDFSEKTANYMKKLGISDDEINSIRNILVEDCRTNTEDGLISDSNWNKTVTSVVDDSNTNNIYASTGAIPQLNATFEGEEELEVTYEWSNGAFDKAGRLVLGNHQVKIIGKGSNSNKNEKTINVYVRDNYKFTGYIVDEEKQTEYYEKEEDTNPKETTTTTTKPQVTTTTTAKTTTKAYLGSTKISGKPSKKLSAKKIKISFKKVKKAKKYTVQFAATKNFKKVLYKKTVKATTVTISNKKLKNKKKLYVRVRAVGAKKWSTSKRIKIKK